MSDIQPVQDEELFSRWVYVPRFMSEDGILNSRFVILREPLKESGISGQLYNRQERISIISDALQFIRKRKDGSNAETLKYIAVAKVGEIRAIAIDNDVIDVVEVPSEKVSSHAEIQFTINGKIVDGTCKDAKLLMYYDELKDLFERNLSEVTLEEIQEAMQFRSSL